MLEYKLPPGEQLADARKKCYLAVQLEAEGLRLFGTNPMMQRRIEPGTTYSYLELKEAAKNHFSPRVSVYKAKYDFTCRLQERDEAVDDYFQASSTDKLSAQQLIRSAEDWLV